MICRECNGLGDRLLRIGARWEGNIAHSLVTPRAAVDVKRIVARKGPAAVVALQAVIPRAGQMLDDANVRDLSRVRRSGDHVVTLIAAYALACGVIPVAKDRREPVIRHGRSVIRRESMAGNA